MITTHTLSRSAERTYWMARYLERAELTARLLSAYSDLLIDLPSRTEVAWGTLVDIVGYRKQFDEFYDEADERNVVRFFTGETRYSGSLLSSVTSARENARTVRETMPRVSFQYVNELYLYTKNAFSGSVSRSARAESFDEIIKRLQQLQGLWQAAMVRTHPWEFLHIGTLIERADMTTRIVDVLSEGMFAEDYELEPFEQHQWRALLRAVYALQSFRTYVQEPVGQDAALQFLFQNKVVPRSYAFCINEIAGSLRRLPRGDKPLSRCNAISRGLATADLSEMVQKELHEYIDRRQVELADLGNLLHATYFDIKRMRTKRG